MVISRSQLWTISFAVLLLGTGLAVDAVKATSYVFPKYDYGQFWVVVLLFFGLLCFSLVLAVRRLLQKRFIESVALIVAIVVAIWFMTLSGDRYFAFLLKRSQYQEIVSRDRLPPPRYHVFNWGNANTHLMGGGFVVEAIIYDESDEVGRSPEAWSADWLQRRQSSSNEDLWITQIPKNHPQCKRTVKDFGMHYYFVSEEC